MNTTRRRFLATVLALPAALTQCSPEPVVPVLPVGWQDKVRQVFAQRNVQMFSTIRFNGCRVGVIRSKDGKTARLVKMVNGQWTSC